MSEQAGAGRRAVLIAAAATTLFAALVVLVSPSPPAPARPREPAALTMREVLETDFATRVQPYVTDDVEVQPDAWRPDDGGDLHTTTYLMSRSREALRLVLEKAQRAGVYPAADADLLLEYITPYPDATDQRPFWRTYEVRREVILDASMLASALGTYDPNTNRPTVLLELTEEGADRFCDATQMLTGRKIATVVGGEVRSAPIVNSAICGGRLSITMGGSDPSSQEAERDALVTTLGGDATGFHEPTWWDRTQPRAYPAKLLFIFGLGTLGGFLALLVIRFAAPRWPSQVRFAGGFPWQRALVTALAPIAIYAGSKISLPFINEVELDYIVGKTGSWTDAFGILSLGITPVLSAFVLVEVVAISVPALRWRRHDPRGRIRLGQVVAGLAAVLGLVQGYFVAIYLESMSRAGVEVVAPGMKTRLLIALTLATGSLLLAALAGIIREHGLGNGYGAIVVSAIVMRTVGQLHLEPSTALMLGRVALVALVTWAMLRARVEDGGRVPLSGLLPVADTAGIALILTMLAGFGLRAPLDAVYEAFARLQSSVIALGILVLVSIGAWSWIFARPPRLSRRAWNRGFLITVAGLLAIWIVTMFTAEVRPFPLVESGFVMIATAVVMDIAADARARRYSLVPAAVLHQIQQATLVERELADIPHHLHASNLRTLLAFFGPCVPVVVLVVPEHAETARAKLAAVLTPSRAKLPEARTI